MLKANFESMQSTLLSSMAQMMRSGSAIQPAGAPQTLSAEPPQSAAAQCLAQAQGDGLQAEGGPPASLAASGYVGGGLKVARTDGSESVTQGLVTTHAPPSFGGTTKLTGDEEGDLHMTD